MKDGSWAKKWDALHEATNRILLADYTELGSFHHRVLLAVIEDVPEEKLLKIVASREAEILADVRTKEIAAKKQVEADKEAQEVLKFLPDRNDALNYAATNDGQVGKVHVAVSAAYRAISAATGGAQ